MSPSKATSTPERAARSSQPGYRFIGGKGGVGKTTCAAALGVASARRGRRTLVISTDPAPSLGDAFGQALGPDPRAIRGIRGLDAVEVDAGAAFASWLDARRATFERIALRGTWLDREDVSRLLRLSLPGIDEIAALIRITELGDPGHYDRIVVDTAPTGHLLRMLNMPAVLGGLAQVFDHMQAKHRIMVDALRGGWSPDAADELIAEIAWQAESMAALLRDRARSSLAWVTLAEPMSVAETADGLEWLCDHGVPVDAVIVNRLTPAPRQSCRWCSARRQLEQDAIHALRRSPAVRGLRLSVIARADREPRGIAGLGAIGRALERPRPPPSRARRIAPHRDVASLPVAGSPVSDARALAPAATRLVMVGGKGGVGKTTCAAAVALAVASMAPTKPVLLLSTDPAHSIGDALGQTLSDTARPVAGGPSNLVARELDAGRVFSAIRDRFGEAIDALFRHVTAGGGVDLTHDRQVMHDLLELAPPGVDELAATIDVLDDLLPPGGDADPAGDARYDLVVMDMAPTGHALRLLEMPSVVHEWVRAVMSILLKYQTVAGVGNLGAVLLGLSRGLGRLRDLIADPVRSRFIVVTRPGVLPREETLRLLDRLGTAGVSAPVLVVNAAGAGSCRRCQADRAAQATEIATLHGALARRTTPAPRILLTAAEVPPPRGVPSLQAWQRRWLQLDSPRAAEARARSRPAARRGLAQRTRSG